MNEKLETAASADQLDVKTDEIFGPDAGPGGPEPLGHVPDDHTWVYAEMPNGEMDWVIVPKDSEIAIKARTQKLFGSEDEPDYSLQSNGGKTLRRKGALERFRN